MTTVLLFATDGEMTRIDGDDTMSVKTVMSENRAYVDGVEFEDIEQVEVSC